MFYKKAAFLFVFCTGLAGGFVFPALAQDATRQADDVAFFTSLEDVPLMPGLTEIPDETVSFDKPEGRIIESSAMMQGVNRQQVSLYYKVSLPQFGWGEVQENVFYRGQEYLELSFFRRGDVDYVRIMVRPTL